ncbi:MAG TPA: cell division protein ZapB [Thermoanaerobaculia bacterium]|nr:cell division protein ZapB [Thermoanaerobaculia bacterium]
MLSLLLSTAVLGQASEERLHRLEAEVKALQAEVATLQASGAALEREKLAEIERRLDLLAGEIERLKIGEAAATADTSQHGYGPAASKIYRTGHGVSIGGYGEMLYTHFASRADDGARADVTDRLDFLRGVIYVGYRWSDRWLLNSELEWEHANTDKGGEAAVEFAYIDYLYRPALSLRAGLLLMPVGFVNELHEPTVFLGAKRPDVERFIIPSTWREGGVGVYGEAGPLSYRAYLVTALAASGFSAAAGLHEGSAEGSNAKANDFAGVARVDYTPFPGLLLGASGYRGNTGQDLKTAAGRSIAVGTRLYEGHLEWKWRGLELRGLAVQANLGDVAALDRALDLAGEHSIGERLRGGYVQLGYDLFARGAHGQQALLPFARWESYNLQARVPAGFAADPANDVKSLTLGLVYRPLDAVVFKADWQNYQNRARTGLDEVHVALGYIF